MTYATLADLIGTLDYLDADADYLDMGITSAPSRLDRDVQSGLVRTITPPVAQESRPVQPCGFRHHHQRTAAGWSAGTWICSIGANVRQHRTAVTDNLRSSPRFAALRDTSQRNGHLLTSDPVFLPFLAGILPDGRTVYRAMLDGLSFQDAATQMGVMS